MLYPPMPRIAVIGSAPYDLSKPYGEYIDSCDIVIRFNKYSVVGHERYVGSKTTIWCYLYHQQMSIWRRDIEPVQEVWVAEQLGRSNIRLIEEDAKMRGARLYRIPQHFAYDLKSKIRFLFPSTGLLGLYTAIRRYKEPIFAIGLGALKLGQPLHYFEPNTIQHSAHSLDRERQMLIRWRREGRILPHRVRRPQH